MLLPPYHLGSDSFDREIMRKVRPFTMTSPERVAALCRSVEYVTDRGIAGAIVECGVWRGGSMMAVALALLRLGAATRQLYLFDTFAGMTTPGPMDIDVNGTPAAALLLAPTEYGNQVRAVASSQEVHRNLAKTGYPRELIHYVVGDVQETLPQCAPEEVAILRLDTDWHASTYHELAHLFPRLVSNGILILDDYGHWQGARQAVDEYLREKRIEAPLLTIDYTARLLIKD